MLHWRIRFKHSGNGGVKFKNRLVSSPKTVLHNTNLKLKNTKLESLKENLEKNFLVSFSFLVSYFFLSEANFFSGLAALLNFTYFWSRLRLHSFKEVANETENDFLQNWLPELLFSTRFRAALAHIQKALEPQKKHETLRLSSEHAVSAQFQCHEHHKKSHNRLGFRLAKSLLLALSQTFSLVCPDIIAGMNQHRNHMILKKLLSSSFWASARQKKLSRSRRTLRWWQREKKKKRKKRNKIDIFALLRWT